MLAGCVGAPGAVIAFAAAFGVLVHGPWLAYQRHHAGHANWAMPLVPVCIHAVDGAILWLALRSLAAALRAPSIDPVPFHRRLLGLSLAAFWRILGAPLGWPLQYHNWIVDRETTAIFLGFVWAAPTCLATATAWFLHRRRGHA